MKNEELFKVGGYIFGNQEDVKKAQEEEKTISYLAQKINFNDTTTTLRIYEKAIQEKVFVTPVGFEFLRRMQRELLSRGVPEEAIRPVPLYQVYSRIEVEKPARKIKRKIKPDKTKVYLGTSILVNITLVAAIIGMFIISLIGETPNMINYRHRIENEYSAWDQELTERETRIKEKERELNLE